MNATENETDSLELAKDAINYTLTRIAKDENIRYHMGAFTEAFERLKQAHSALNGISETAIEAEIFAVELKRKPAAKLVEEVKELIYQWQAHESNEREVLIKIGGILQVPF